KGGQSAMRFQRLRLIAINEFYKKVADRANDIFLAEPEFFERFKGVLIGGPTPTKDEFESGEFLHHELQKRIIGLFDVSYTNESGLAELVDNAADALRGVEVMKEKVVMDRFFKELVKDDGLSSYGEESVRKNLDIGAVDTLLLSGVLRESRIKIRCQNCNYVREETVMVAPGKKLSDIELGICPKCSAPVYIEEETDIIDELAALADAGNTKVMIISDDFEEGAMLFNAFGGIAGILRYRTGY
ncbi:MAG: peptide chain release factor aRF-1, partial [Methanomicrobium sp.]|nr:peptide chain release factor aRF-1 [Methanomicrobium sp.]